MMTTDQMEDEIKSLHIKEMITRILTWCAVALAIFMAITADPTLALIFLVIAVVLGVLRIRATKSIDKISKSLEDASTMVRVEANLKFLRIKVTVFRVLTHGSVAVAFILLAVTKNFLIFLGLLIIALAFGVPTGRMIRKRNETQNHLGERVLNEVIRNLLGNDVEYDPSGVVKPGSMLVPFHYEKVSGEHHIKTVYNGVNMELSNTRLYVEETDNEYGTRSLFRFHGPWLICDFGRKPACNVYISARPKKDNKLMQSNVKIDDEQFDSRFCVRAVDPQEAYKILTPQMMEAISAVADKSGGALYMSFLSDGQTHVAIQTGHNFLAIEKCYAVEEFRQKFEEELRRVLGSIDTLNV